jgi:hypothetical protein
VVLQAELSAGKSIEDLAGVGDDGLFGLAHQVALEPVAVEVLGQELV